MAVPIMQAVRVGAYVVKQHLSGRKRYPLVLMLEPLFRCNLACAGCGKIDYPAPILNQRLSVQECLDADTECGAPVIAVAGGEPLLHKEMPEIIAGLLARKKYVYLCTNALLLDKKLDDYAPNPYFSWDVHLDGDQTMHDAVGLPGRGVRPGGRGNPQGQGARLPRLHQLHGVRRCAARAAGGVLRHRHGDGRRRHHDRPRLRLRARPRPGALPQPPEDQAAVPRRVPSAGRAASGSSRSRRCS